MFSSFVDFSDLRTLFGVRVSSLGLLATMAACATAAFWEEVLSLLSQAQKLKPNSANFGWEPRT